mmetsp:Transcript_20164/g.48101  ORF Transcript_20164/g.48101 Transcript_20164/m.48101 type:complete len:711 (+) Transcript_20164:1150-3282(+)
MPVVVQLRHHQHLQVGHARPAVPLVGDVASVHDLAEDVLEIGVRHRLLGARAGAHVEHVDSHLRALGEIAHGEAVDVAAAPADEAELAPAVDERVEAAQREEHRLKVLLAQARVHERLVERLPGAQQVGAQRLGRLVGNLDGVLEDRLGDRLLPRERGRLGGEEAAEVGVGAFLRLLQLALERLDPQRHEMDVLQEHPAALLHAPLQRLLRHGLLSLSHGNVDELAVLHGEPLLPQKRVQIADNVGARKEVEEARRLRRRLPVDIEDVERLLVDEHLAKLVEDQRPQRGRQPVRTRRAQQAQLLKLCGIRVLARRRFQLRAFQLDPLVPLLGRSLNVSRQLGEGRHLGQAADRLPDALRHEVLHLGVHGGGAHVLGSLDHEQHLLWVEESSELIRSLDVRVALQNLEEDAGHEQQLVLVEQTSSREVVHLIRHRVRQLLQPLGQIDVLLGVDCSIFESVAHASLDHRRRKTEPLERVLPLRHLDDLGHMHPISVVLLSGKINSLEEDPRECCKRVMVEAVHFVQLSESEEQQRCAISHASVIFTCLVDRDLRLLGDGDLLADVDRRALRVLEGLNQRHILRDVALRLRELPQQIIFQLLQLHGKVVLLLDQHRLLLLKIRPLLRHHLRQQLVFQTILCHHEVDERALGLDLGRVMRVRQLGVEDQLEVGVVLDLLVADLDEEIAALLDLLPAHNRADHRIERLLQVLDHH